MSVTIEEYLTEDNRFDYDKLWMELSRMTGFRAEEERGKRFEEVRSAYSAYKASKSNNDVPETVVSEDRVPQQRPMATEQEVISFINEQSGTTFKLAEDKYSTYDAEDPNYIAEIKIRNKHYDDCLIEYDKYMGNRGIADITGKHFLYIVVANPHIYVFNIHKLRKINWEYKEMPRNSHFGGYDDKKLKKVGYINVRRARVRYNFINP